jgi:hypothetical protein
VYSMKEMNAACGAVEGRSVQRQIAGIGYSLHQMDCLEWMDLRPPNHVHAIVTDPPYGLKEYTVDERRKLRSRRGGIWRIPPSYDGCQRSPVPRFTVLTEADRTQLRAFFVSFAQRSFRILVPGGHLFIASHPLSSAGSLLVPGETAADRPSHTHVAHYPELAQASGSLEKSPNPDSAGQSLSAQMPLHLPRRRAAHHRG